MRTCTVLLEYCGGRKTDRLYAQLSKWNQDRYIAVLDNASPRNRCGCITIQNDTNSFIGGGINDSIAHARKCGAEYLFLIMNDVVPLTGIDIGTFEATMVSRPEVVQVGCSMTISHAYPWMVWRRGGAMREVPHSDIMCSMMRLDFIDQFGGFPVTKSGWGYDLEIAYHAHFQRKVILVSDQHVISHSARFQPEVGTNVEKAAEMEAVYQERYLEFSQTVRRIMYDFVTKSAIVDPNRASGLKN